MKPHLTLASTALTEHPGIQEGKARALAHPLTTDERGDQTQGAPARTRPAPISVPAWRHKLILTGSLDSRTVVELEDEIDCLCEEGVTSLTLDLRQLDAIDPVGARAIACGGAACKERRRDFAVLPGSPVVRRVLSEAGAENLLAADSGEQRALPFVASAAGAAPRDTWTVMVKNL
jgi:anti-anti-sigma regulatory factor